MGWTELDCYYSNFSPLSPVTTRGNEAIITFFNCLHACSIWSQCPRMTSSTFRISSPYCWCVVHMVRWDNSNWATIRATQLEHIITEPLGEANNHSAQSRNVFVCTYVYIYIYIFFFCLFFLFFFFFLFFIYIYIYICICN